MKRYKIPPAVSIKENSEGEFVLYMDALEAMHVMIQFALNHAEDITNGVNDFGDLKPVLDMMPPQNESKIILN